MTRGIVPLRPLLKAVNTETRVDTTERWRPSHNLHGPPHNLGSEVMAPPGSDDRTLSCGSALFQKLQMLQCSMLHVVLLQ